MRIAPRENKSLARYSLLNAVSVAIVLLLACPHILAADNLTAEDMETLVDVTPTPSMNHSFALMEEGVLQHVDRSYDYYYMPDAMRGGLLYQGVHRAPLGQQMRMEMAADCTIYYFWHHSVDGGYGSIFPSLPGWTMVATGDENDAPKYDSIGQAAGWSHGKPMFMATYQATAGEIIDIPATTVADGAFSIVFKFDITKPDAPSDVAVLADGNTMTVSWTDNALEETGYSIERAASLTSEAFAVTLDAYNGVEPEGAFIAAENSLNSFKANALQASDRTDKITMVPDSLEGATRLVVPRDDKSRAERPDMYVVSANKDCIVYLGLDDLLTTLPNWVTAQGWEYSGLTFNTSNSSSNPWVLYQKTFPAGQISLGSVRSSTTGSQSGAVFVFVPQGLVWEQVGLAGLDVTAFQEAVSPNTDFEYRVRALGQVVDSAYANAGTVSAGAGVIATYALWASGEGLAVDSTGLDADYDGVVNYLEFALAGDPHISDSGILPAMTKNGDYWDFTFHRGQAGPTYVVQSSVDLINWKDELINPGLIGGDVTVSINRDESALFMRLEVNE